MLQTKAQYLQNLEKHQFHKLIIGAALKDYKTIEEFAYLFTHAEADAIDISAFPHSVISARKGIEQALKEDTNLIEPLIMVSVNIGQDPHFRRIELKEENCTECLACIPECPSGAFRQLEVRSSKLEGLNKEPLTSNLQLRTDQEYNFSYIPDLCFGCALCLPACHFDALEFTNWSAFETKSIIELQELGARAIEIHLNNDLDSFSSFYKSIPEFELESFCIGSGQMNKQELIQAAEFIIQEVKNKYDSNKKLIIQVDGKAMSGASVKLLAEDQITSINGTHASTDQVSIDHAKSIMHLQSDTVFIQLAGGITEKSLSKAFGAGVRVNGVAIGSYARKQISEIKDKDQQIKFAKKLITKPGT